MSILESIKKYEDIKSLSIESLKLLAGDVREKIISATYKNGGHLASSLGTVEIIIALLYVFDFNKDKIIFDVGHQAYAYKILTDRKDGFDDLKTSKGISGFPLIFESKFDSFSSGHAGDALAAALGYAVGRDKLGDDYYVISFIGDGAFCNGETLEALTNSSKKPRNFLTILNDNGMSIAENSSALFNCENSVKEDIKNVQSLQVFDNKKSTDLSSVSQCLNFAKFGYEYSEIADGHDLEKLIKFFTEFKKSGNPCFLHVKTKKGKGYLPAEEKSEIFHGVNKNFAAAANDFSDSLGDILLKKIQDDKNIVVIVAGMSLGVGVDQVKKRFPDNFIDVGIAEDFAVTLASGLALSGVKPIVCIYSTFLQRAYDQLVTNVCLQKLPVTFLIDHAGLVGDGYTHQGVFDTAYLSHVPNITVLSPKNPSEMQGMIDYALKSNAPVAIRYPVGKIEDVKTVTPFTSAGEWEVLKNGSGACILAAGCRAVTTALKAAQGTDCEVVNARSIKPLDNKYLLSRFDRNFITVEDGVKIGGFGSMVSTFLSDRGYKGSLKIFALNDAFIPHGTVEELFSLSDLTVDEIKKYL